MARRFHLLLLLLVVPVAALAQETAAQDPAAHAGWLSILPPVAAIALALIFRQVIPALFFGVWVGAWIVNGLDAGGLWSGLLDAAQIYVLGALADSDRAAIILFSLLIGGMVGIVSRNGGMQGVVQLVVRWASNARRAMVATSTMGLVIFFDDYANTLVVGNTMRSVTDRMKISREKLAYLVDSTAAPVACIALVTTWIGYEVGLIGTAIEKIDLEMDAYALFLESLPYSFYPILALAFVYMVSFSGRDFGPMLAAERREQARTAEHSETHGLEEAPNPHHDVIQPVPDKPHRAVNAVIPVAVLVAGVIIGLWVTGGGEGKSFREVIGDADSYKALIWASLVSVVTAAGLSLSQGILSLEQTVDSWFMGARSMLFAIIILVLAWSLSDVADALGTAAFLVSTLGEALHPGIVPTLVFLLAAGTAFATGSSWSTMGILMPLVIPLTWAVIGGAEGFAGGQAHVLYSTVSCVLAGAVWGDHCSPISDTTILSSMASGCDHIAHVRTQLPYALLVGMVCIVVAILPVGFGVPWWISMILAAGLLFAILRIAGQPREG
ncbi:MAG: Na+/H+ antiporter NhaC family protein [Xanthomonadales bacterium]|nr:Na+/H+ antiporter NhaC family protein [Xanthomonadales bacterium]